MSIFKSFEREKKESASLRWISLL